MIASRSAGVGVAVLLLLLLSSTASSTARPWHWLLRTQHVDLTASAQPTAADPDVVDRVFGVNASPFWRSKADATAMTSATCDKCTGEATTLQVLYVRQAGSTRVDNNAVAWSRCRSCAASALSVQVVVVRRGVAVEANNRALAVNAVCDECQTSAGAYQLVVVSPDAGRLSRGAMSDLRAWVARQRDLLRSLAPRASTTGPPSGRRAAGTPPHSSAAAEDRAGGARLPGALPTLEELVNSDLGSVTDEAHADVHAPGPAQ
ncbi:MAG TPA: hypothetical protein VFL69_04565 [Marmoricola sp.]|nr:hypothetical protein [Marmoricola sp.]